MKTVKVLGSGCTKCANTAELIKKIAEKNNISVDVIKETNPEVLLNYGVMSSPAVIVDNQLVHSGSIPDREKVETWLEVRKNA